MTREKAQDEILVRLDEIQQILDLLDPERKAQSFSAVIERSRNYSRIAFNLLYPETLDALLEYDEE